MTVIAKPLFQPVFAAAADTTQYTAGAGVRTIIDKFTAMNNDAVARTLTVYLVASGGAAGATNTVVKTKSLAAGETYTFPEIVGHVLASGDFIATNASAAGVVSVRASGREIT
jgi:hypothetical protein